MAESLGLRISKSEVSRICAGLDEQVDVFRNRPWRAATPTCGWMRRLVGRRYLSNHSLETVLDDDNQDNNREETRELTAV